MQDDLLSLNPQDAEEIESGGNPPFDHIRDELPYIQILNRVLPPDVRILAWCPHIPESFSARFNCKERRYRYFFTNPGYLPLPGRGSEEGRKAGPGWLDIDAMQAAAQKYEGLHDFRNLCKVDPGKQITNFQRRIFHAGIHEIPSDPRFSTEDGLQGLITPKLYYFEVRGSAFLWHQVRHLVAILFLIGQGYEQPSLVDELLDTEKTPAKPIYEMASDIPLVLWDCIFPSEVGQADHAIGAEQPSSGYRDALDWIFVGDEVGGRDTAKPHLTAVEDGKYGRNGILDSLWALWRARKMDEILAWSLMDVVAVQGKIPDQPKNGPKFEYVERSDRVFDGGEIPRTVGTYVPVMQRERTETPEVLNARYAARKGLTNGRRRPLLDEAIGDE